MNRQIAFRCCRVVTDITTVWFVAAGIRFAARQSWMLLTWCIWRAPFYSWQKMMKWAGKQRHREGRKKKKNFVSNERISFWIAATFKWLSHRRAIMRTFVRSPVDEAWEFYRLFSSKLQYNGKLPAKQYPQALSPSGCFSRMWISNVSWYL